MDTTFSTLSDDFLTHGLYLRGWSARTIRTYRQGLATLPVTLTKTSLAGWVVEQRQRGLTPGGINMYARTINSYLSWLHAEGHLSDRLRIKRLPNPPKPLRALSDAEIRRLVMFRPHGRLALRTWTIIVTLLDTGLRIDEALGLERGNVDLQNLMLRVRGKGNREQAGVVGAHVHPHAFRHCFAVTYVRNGGDIYRLSRILGHASISTTQIYLRSMGIDVIGEGHERLTPLNLRRV